MSQLGFLVLLFAFFFLLLLCRRGSQRHSMVNILNTNLMSGSVSWQSNPWLTQKPLQKHMLQSVALLSPHLYGVKNYLFQRSNKSSLFLAFLKCIPKSVQKGFFSVHNFAFWVAFYFCLWGNEYIVFHEKALVFLKNEFNSHPLLRINCSTLILKF